MAVDVTGNEDRRTQNTTQENFLFTAFASGSNAQQLFSLSCFNFIRHISLGKVPSLLRMSLHIFALAGRNVKWKISMTKIYKLFFLAKYFLQWFSACSATSGPRHSKLLTKEELEFNITFLPSNIFYTSLILYFTHAKKTLGLTKSGKRVKISFWKIKFVICPVNTFLI